MVRQRGIAQRVNNNCHFKFIWKATFSEGGVDQPGNGMKENVKHILSAEKWARGSVD